MRRRTFLQSISAAAVATALPASVMAQGSGLKLRITDIKVRKTRVVRELGTVALRSGLGGMTGGGADVSKVVVGGESFVEISTDGGITGIGEGVSPAMLARARALLIGKDPFLIDQHAYDLFNPDGGGANVEIALWDLIGKALNQPLWKLWGGAHDTLMPYASQHSVGTPEERARMAQTVFADGWRAIKFRAHFPTIKEDVALVEQTRKAMGPDFKIMCDVNQAGNYPDGWGGGNVRWDLRRAMETAKEWERLDLFWMEEPLPRWDYDGLAKLTASTPLLIAGGEGQHGLHEYKWMDEKGVFDIYQFEAGIIGPTIARQVATLAVNQNKYCIGHVGGGLTQLCSGHLAASFTNAPKLTNDYPNNPTWEIFYEPPVETPFAHWEVFEKPPVMDKAKGTIRLPDAPGLGVTYKADVIVNS